MNIYTRYSKESYLCRYFKQEKIFKIVVEPSDVIISKNDNFKNDNFVGKGYASDGMYKLSITIKWLDIRVPRLDVELVETLVQRFSSAIGRTVGLAS